MRRALLISALAVGALTTVTALGSLTGGPSTVAAQGPAPDAITNPATNVTQHEARLNGSVNPRGTATTYTFQFGPTPAYGVETSPPQNAGAGTAPVAAAANLTGLQSGMTYHYRIVARNAAGQTTNGIDRTFTTGPTGSTLGLFGHTAFVSPSRIVGVFTGCFGGRFCTASMRMTSGGVEIGSRSTILIRPNGGGIVHVALNREGRRRVARNRRLPTVVTVTGRGGASGSSATKSVTVVPFQ